MNTNDKIVDDLDDIFEEIASEMDSGYLDKAAELEAIAISGGDKNLWQSEYLVIRARKIQKEREAAKLKQEQKEKKLLHEFKARKKAIADAAKKKEFNFIMITFLSFMLVLFILSLFHKLIT